MEYTNSVLDFLASFFLIFKARIEIYKEIDNRIIGTLIFDDEVDEDDKQDFSLSLENLNLLPEAKLYCDFLIENNLVDLDKILLSEEELLKMMIKSGWNKDKAKKSIDFLFSFGVRMVDDGKEADTFFIHN